MKLLAFLKSPVGSLAVFVAFVVVGGLLLHQSTVLEQARSTQMTKIGDNSPSSLRETISRLGQPLKLPASATRATVATSQAAAGDSVTQSPRNAGAKEAKPRVLPISLFASAAPSATDGAVLSKTYAPYGRLIPCETVVTLESSRLETPVIGLVTEDVWHDGRLIIPAGTEVHGRAALDRSRERIAATGKWVVVWRDGSPMNGTELVLNGIALEREKDDVTGEFGLRDGSAGLVGQLFKTDRWEEVKLFASTFLAGAASGLQELQTQGTALGLAQVPVASGRNAALQGTAAVLNAYARQIQEAIERDGFFVRV